MIITRTSRETRKANAEILQIIYRKSPRELGTGRVEGVGLWKFKYDFVVNHSNRKVKRAKILYVR